MKSKKTMLILKVLQAWVAIWIIFILCVFFCGLIGKFIMVITEFASVFCLGILMVLNNPLKEFMKIHRD